MVYMLKKTWVADERLTQIRISICFQQAAAPAVWQHLNAWGCIFTAGVGAAAAWRE